MKLLPTASLLLASALAFSCAGAPAAVSRSAAPAPEGADIVAKHAIVLSKPHGGPTAYMATGPLLGNGDLGVMQSGPADALLLPAAADPAESAATADIAGPAASVKNTFTQLPGRGWASTAAPLMGNGDMGVCILGRADEMLFLIGKNDFWRLKRSPGQISALPFGAMKLTLPEFKGAALQLTQTPVDAAIRGTLTLKDGSGIDFTTFVAATENALIIRLEARGNPRSVEVGIAPETCAYKENATSGTRRGVAWISREFTEGVDTSTGASAALKVSGADGPKFTLTPGRPVTLLVALKSNFQTEKHLDAAVELAERAEPAKLFAEHRAWWAVFWGKSSVEVDDAEIMRRYYTAQYVLASASRDPKFPPGIIGPWITTSSNVFAWGAYWMNYNHVAPFYGLYSSNHIEQADPQDAPILAFMPRGQEYARKLFNSRGVLYPVGLGPLGFDILANPSPKYPHGLEQGIPTHGQRSNAAYSLVNMGARWRTTLDPEYARKIYPFVLDVVDFWEDYLTLEDGRFVVNNEAVHEGSGKNKNPVSTLGLVRHAFRLALDMSEDMGVDENRRAKWRDILARLSAYPTQEHNGKTVFILAENGPVIWGSNTVHIQHIYPAGQLGLDSDPKLLEIARNTIAAYPRWYDLNGSNSFFPAAARVGYDPKAILDALRRYPIGPNGFLSRNMHGIENCSTVPNTVNEMLMQSHEGVLRFFPVWPKDTDAAFTHLRAYGAFLVSAQLKAGEISGVKILSEKGRDCTVVNPWPDRKAQVFRNGKKAETVAGERFTLKTTPGEILELSAQ